LEIFLRASRRARERTQLSSRAREVLQAADRILMRGGIADVSLRKVAEEAGFSLATVQHYFPLKADLIREMMEVRVDSYQDRFSDLVLELPDRPDEAFDRVVGWFTSNAANSQQGGWWFHFWALASHDPVARETLDRSMLLYRQTLAVVISGLNPNLSKTEALTRAAMISCAIDGSMLLTASDKPRHVEIEHIPEALLRFARLTAEAPE
jgi:AcrR family transcriptional regulator